MAGEKLAFVSAGGTGGHLFPAAALSGELRARGWTVHLLTDERAEKWSEDFPADAIHRIPSATFGSKNPLAVARAAMRIITGIAKARKWARRMKPAVVVGFGGYPTLPPVMGAALAGVPTVIHEQNAVMGRANKALAARVDAIAGGFLKPEGPFRDRIVVTGNPVRPAVMAASALPYEAPEADGRFRLLVFGGSQGARFFSEALPQALGRLPMALRARIDITQQARAEDEAIARKGYDEIGMSAELAPFFTDMPVRIAKAHFVIARSGASTVSEIAAIGRPALLVPYPHALDHDQAANAARLAETGGVIVKPQSELDPVMLAGLIADAMGNGRMLAEKAAAARGAGQPGATGLLADLVESIARGETAAAFRARLQAGT